MEEVGEEASEVAEVAEEIAEVVDVMITGLMMTEELT
jgi:hypothetical protein